MVAALPSLQAMMVQPWKAQVDRPEESAWLSTTIWLHFETDMAIINALEVLSPFIKFS